MPLANDPHKVALGGEGKWGDFVGDIGRLVIHTPEQVHAAQLAVVEIGAKYDPEDAAMFLGMLGIYRKVDHDDDSKDC